MWPGCIWGMEEEEEEEDLHICTSYPAIQRVSIAVDEANVLPGALQLIRKLRPQWETERVKSKVQTQSTEFSCRQLVANTRQAVATSRMRNLGLEGINENESVAASGEVCSEE